MVSSKIKICVDYPCSVYIDFKEYGDITPNSLMEIPVRKGGYIVDFRLGDIVITSLDVCVENEEEKLVRVNLKSLLYDIFDINVISDNKNDFSNIDFYVTEKDTYMDLCCEKEEISETHWRILVPKKRLNSDFLHIKYRGFYYVEVVLIYNIPFPESTCIELDLTWVCRDILSKIIVYENEESTIQTHIYHSALTIMPDIIDGDVVERYYDYYGKEFTDGEMGLEGRRSECITLNLPVGTHIYNFLRKTHIDDFFIIHDSKNRLGLFNRKSQSLLIPCEYTKIIEKNQLLEHSNVKFEGFSSLTFVYEIEKNGKKGIIDEDGNCIIPPLYDNISDGILTKEGKYSRIEEPNIWYDDMKRISGNRTLILQDPEIRNGIYSYGNGILFFKKNDKWGYWDAANKYHNAIYSNVDIKHICAWISDSYNMYLLVESDGKKGLLDYLGNEAVPCIYDEIVYWSHPWHIEEFFIMEHFYSKSHIIPHSYENWKNRREWDVNPTSGLTAIVRNDCYFGMVGYFNTQIVPIIYHSKKEVEDAFDAIYRVNPLIGFGGIPLY